jgi:excisionase family DNA binding protein
VETLLLKPEEAAQCLGICRSKIYELMRAGALESVRIGASRRIPTSAVARFVEELSSDTEPRS